MCVCVQVCLCLDVSISHVCLEQIDPGKRIPCFHKYVEVRTDGWINKMFSEGEKKKKDMETGIFDSCSKKWWLMFYRKKGLFVCKESA